MTSVEADTNQGEGEESMRLGAASSHFMLDHWCFLASQHCMMASSLSVLLVIIIYKIIIRSMEPERCCTVLQSVRDLHYLATEIYYMSTCRMASHQDYLFYQCIWLPGPWAETKKAICFYRHIQHFFSLGCCLSFGYQSSTLFPSFVVSLEKSKMIARKWTF